MDVASPKLAIGIRGNEDIGNRDQYRYHLFIEIVVYNDVWLDFTKISKII